MKDILIQIGSYFLVFIITFVFFNFLSKGYLFNYIKVKLSRGKKVLGRIRSINGVYFKTGKIIEMNRFSYKSRDGMNLMFTLTPNCIKEEMGIKVVEYDEVNKCVTDSDGEVYKVEINKAAIPEGQSSVSFNVPFNIQQENPDTNDTLYKRCLMRPSLDKPNVMLIIALVLIGLTLFATLYGITQMGKYHAEDISYLQSSYNMTRMMFNMTVTARTGVVI